MAYQNLSSKKSLDWIALTVYISLLVVGWMMLYAAVYDEQTPYAFLDLSSVIGKQTMWLGLSLVAFVVVYITDSNIWSTMAFPAYLGSLLLLVLVLFLGNEIKGARSWFDFGLFSVQPSEIAKLTTLLAISSFYSSYKRDIKRRQDFLISLGIIGAPMFLILLQPDAGSALVFLSFFLLFFRLGLPIIYFILGFLVVGVLILSIMYGPQLVTLLLCILLGIIFLANMNRKLRSFVILILGSIGAIILHMNNEFLWAVALMVAVLGYLGFYIVSGKKSGLIVATLPALLLSIGLAFGTNWAFESVLKPHQQDRINVWLRPDKCDPHGSLYNIIQSKLAIGSGGLEGKGFLQGDMTKLNYVPEQTTDFIFSTIGEEQGFIGTLGVILLFMMLLIRIIFIGERSRSKFVRNYAYGLAGIIFFHFFLNIGMTLGLMPVIGIPLPFISKGGSSLLIFSVMIAILIKIDSARLNKA